MPCTYFAFVYDGDVVVVLLLFAVAVAYDVDDDDIPKVTIDQNCSSYNRHHYHHYGEMTLAEPLILIFCSLSNRRHFFLETHNRL